MRTFFKWIVAHKKAIIVCFVIFTVISLICKPLIAVNYDLNAYLPQESPSTVSLELLKQEFSGGIPNGRVMLRDVSVPQAIAYKEKLEKIDGVTEVLWLDDAADITMPLEIMDQDMVETYYQDGAALLTLTIADDKRQDAVDEIRQVIGEGNALSGSAVATAVAATSTVTEVPRIAVIAVCIVSIILLLTTGAWAEPLIVLCGLGVAVLLNDGSNLLFGEISFVTNAAGNILQLAVSLDYSVFLLHRFLECRKENPNTEAAMVEALCKSASSILSSGLTTVIGFLALCLMQFQIGPDLGRALAKGIAISLIVVFVFSPALILSTYKLVDKTGHRPLLPGFSGLGKLVRRTMLPAVLLLALLVTPAYLASNHNDFYYGSSRIFGEETRLGQDMKSVNDVFGKSDTYVLMVPRGDLAKEQALSAALREIPQITSILSYVDTVGAEIPMEYLDHETLSLLMSERYSRMVLSVNADFEGPQTFSVVKTVREIASSYYPEQTYLAGEGVSTYDLMNTITADMVKVNFVAIASVFLVLVITMKSALLPAVLVLSIEAAIWINLAIPYFRSSVLFYIAYLIVSSVQLGATVDYAILLTERYKDLRKEAAPKQAVEQTVSGVALSILTSGVILTIVGFLLGKISSHGVLSQLGALLGSGTMLSLLIVFFALPGLLCLLDRWIVRAPKTK